MVLLVVADAVEVPQCFDAGGTHVLIGGRRAVAARGIFSEIVNDSAGGNQPLRVIVEAETREFGDAKLFAQDALGVVALKNPIFEAGFHATHDFAANEFLARAGLLHLIADRDFEAGADQARDVALGGVVWNAAHRNRLALFAVARGE